MIILEDVAETVTDDYVLFWGGVFSNWYKSPFRAGVHNFNKKTKKIEEHIFNCAEQYMMFKKALFFDSSGSGNFSLAYKDILTTKDPRKQKELGRSVRNFDADLWLENCILEFLPGLIQKYKQNPRCFDALMETGNRTIVEASPYDTIWGIGLATDDPDALDPKKWRGKNLLGESIMMVRQILRKYDGPNKASVESSS